MQHWVLKVCPRRAASSSGKALREWRPLHLSSAQPARPYTAILHTPQHLRHKEGTPVQLEPGKITPRTSKSPSTPLLITSCLPHSDSNPPGLTLHSALSKIAQSQNQAPAHWGTQL